MGFAFFAIHDDAELHILNSAINIRCIVCWQKRALDLIMNPYPLHHLLNELRDICTAILRAAYC